MDREMFVDDAVVFNGQVGSVITTCTFAYKDSGLTKHVTSHFRVFKNEYKCNTRDGRITTGAISWRLFVNGG